MTNATSPATPDTYPTAVFTSILTGDEAFLADHVIQGHRILPGAAYLEMARAAVALSTTIGDEHIIVLRDSVFVQPMIVTHECAVETKVYPGADGECGVEVITGQGVHFQSRACIEATSKAGGATSPPAPLDVPALEIDRVLAPKVEGVEYLDEATADLRLDFFITLSSVAGSLGNATSWMV